MSSTPPLKKALLYLSVCLSLVAASGVLQALPHDHEPGEYCHVCSPASTCAVAVDHHVVESYELVAAPAPAVQAASHSRDSILAAPTQRGPPTAS